jgi:stress response protein YsnF/uncharacterized protein YdeI (BOF family)
MKKGLKSIPLTLLALSTITIVVGCQSGRTYHTTGLAPIRSDDQGYRYAAGRSGSVYESSRSATSATTQEGSTIEVPLYEETLRVGTREVDAGGVRLRKEVQTETVNQPVQLKRETLVIDRLPAGSSQPATAQSQFSGAGELSTPFQQREMEIRLKREEPVVETQVVEKGRIVAQKRTETQQQSVQRQVRREDIDVTRLGNAENVIISENLRREQNAGATGPAAASTTAAGGSAGMVTDISMLNAANASTFAGRQVRISGTVQQMQGDRAFIVSGNGNQILVRTSQPISTIKQGDQVQISGSLDRMPDDSAALGVSQEQRQQLQNQSVYIEASSVTALQQ